MTYDIPKGSKAFERKLNAAAAAGVQDAITRENAERRRLPTCKCGAILSAVTFECVRGKFCPDEAV